MFYSMNGDPKYNQKCSEMILNSSVMSQAAKSILGKIALTISLTF